LFCVNICLVYVISLALRTRTLSPVAGLTSVNIFPPGSKPYGLTYDEHIKNFWKWNLAIPAKDNPINDPTGDKCATGQPNTSSSVFYLAYNNGGFSQRTCKVPAGKALFIPLMPGESSGKEFPKASIQDLNRSAAADQNSVNSLYLKIGDKVYNYQDLLKYKHLTGVLNVTFPDKGIFGVLQGGPTVAIADGFYVITEPLAKGTYPIHFKSSLLCTQPDCTSPNFAQDITYTIIAQ
jgi:hypothetical protein